MRARLWHATDRTLHALHINARWACQRYDRALVRYWLWTPDQQPTTCTPHPRNQP